MEDLYKRIKKDKRHLQLDVLSKGWSKERMFTSWYMGYIDLDEQQEGEKNKLVREAIKELQSASVKSEFTPKVFWYNVFHLLSASKFYRDF